MALTTPIPYIAHNIRNDKRGRSRPLLYQLVSAVVKDVLIPRAWLQKHNLTAAQVTRVLLQHHIAVACGCAPKEEPMWTAVSTLFGGLDNIEKQFVDPLHQKLVSREIQVDRSKNSRVELGPVPCLDEAAMFLQHLQDAPWLLNVPDLLQNLRLAAETFPPSPCLLEIQSLLLMNKKDT